MADRYVQTTNTTWVLGAKMTTVWWHLHCVALHGVLSRATCITPPLSRVSWHFICWCCYYHPSCPSSFWFMQFSWSESSFPLTYTWIGEALHLHFLVNVAKLAYASDRGISQSESTVPVIKEATNMYRRNTCSLLRAQRGASSPSLWLVCCGLLLSLACLILGLSPVSFQPIGLTYLTH